MDDPVKLACPRCELVYRLKKYTPGKNYACKSCGSALVPADSVTSQGTRGDRPASYDNSADILRGRGAIAPGQAPESDLSRLPALISELTSRLDSLQASAPDADDDASPAARLLRLNEELAQELRAASSAADEKTARLERDVRELSGAVTDRLDTISAVLTAPDAGPDIGRALATVEEKLASALGEFAAARDNASRRLQEMQERLSRLADNAGTSSAGLEDVKKALLRQQEEAARRAEEEKRDAANRQDRQRRDFDAFREAQREALLTHRDEQRKTLDGYLAPLANPPSTTVEVDIEDLADRLVAGVRGHSSLLNHDSDTAMDAMARLADELVKEQNANTLRLDKLAEEIHTAAAGIATLEEWRGDLPERVADEIGQTVEARVVGPISDSLTRHAPAILAELHDSKLVDLVSRSVREAQRPLLREILAGGRRGVPLWLFASVLLPLLLILGYLFLPGEYGLNGDDEAAVAEETAASLARIESGMSAAADNVDRLRTIEDAVLDIHSEALAHVKNAAALEEEVKNLRTTLAERDKLLEEYQTTLQTQVKRLREYEMRLSRLGVTPKAEEK